MARDFRPVLCKDMLAEGIDFAETNRFVPRSLESKTESSNAAE
jgi:hypothetical protein